MDDDLLEIKDETKRHFWEYCKTPKYSWFVYNCLICDAHASSTHQNYECQGWTK